MFTLPRFILAPCTLACGLLLTACDAPEAGDGDDETTGETLDSDTDEGTTSAGDDRNAGPEPSLLLEADEHPALDPPKDPGPIEGPGYVTIGGNNWRRLATEDNFCFLTVVSGKFTGTTDYVEVLRSEQGYGWYLAVQAHDPGAGMTAAANCVPLQWYGATLTYTAEYFWNQASSPVDLGPATSRVCFLTRVQGALRGSGDRVEVSISNGRWYLKGSGASGNILAGARCINTPRRVGPVNWSQGLPQQLLADTYWRCGLTKLAGKFDGWGEKVAITVADDSWYLGGTSYQTGVAGSGHCM